MAPAPNRKVNRNEILELIKELIQESPNKEVEIASSELADRFDVQAPTMDYHLNKLVEDGLLSLSKKRGKYKRKIYLLPKDTSKSKEEKPANKPKRANVILPNDSKEYSDFINSHLKSAGVGTEQKEQADTNVQKEEVVQEEAPVVEPAVEDKQESITFEPPATPQQTIPEIESKELTLDQRIEKFLQNAQSVHDANVLFTHDDREILSVLNETVQQNMFYLKDLSDQLSTVQNKMLIQQLIDDRNDMMKRMEALEREADEARAMMNKTIEKNEIDPKRVRFMQQVLVDTADSFVNQTNQSMAIGRKKFRDKLVKEISDLVKYTLRLED